MNHILLFSNDRGFLFGRVNTTLKFTHVNCIYSRTVMFAQVALARKSMIIMDTDIDPVAWFAQLQMCFFLSKVRT